LEALVSDQSGSINKFWEVTGLQVSTGMSGIPTATVKMRGPDGVERFVATTGTGPVDAVYKAIDSIMGVSVKLESYTMNSVTEGIEVCCRHPLLNFIFFFNTKNSHISFLPAHNRHLQQPVWYSHL
jgi:hypothetical protein